MIIDGGVSTMWALPPFIATVLLAPSGTILHIVGNNRINDIQESNSLAIGPAIIPINGHFGTGIALSYSF